MDKRDMKKLGRVESWLGEQRTQKVILPVRQTLKSGQNHMLQNLMQKSSYPILKSGLKNTLKVRMLGNYWRST